LVGAIVGFASCLGDFGAVITFAGNIHGKTQTLPLAIFTALQTPNGGETAARLSLVSVTLAITGLLASQWVSRRVEVLVGR
jgi:molybdate transport system permease protein